MPADTDVLDYPRGRHLAGLSDRPVRPAGAPQNESDEAACPAFGFLRGTRDRALMVEFRLATGDTVTLPYSWLGPVRYNPSVGLLLKFTGDVVTLVLIRGSNLDAAVAGGVVNLTDRGLHRHRILWVREMTADETRAAGKAEPTVDAIQVAEFESHADLMLWLADTAPPLAAAVAAPTWNRNRGGSGPAVVPCPGDDER
jgi:hypothetical protein